MPVPYALALRCTTVSEFDEYLDSYLPEDEALTAARARATDLGSTPIEPAAGSALRFLATSLGARAVVEVGTGAGVSSLYLLNGMLPDGVLTSIDIEPELHRAARQAFADARFAPSRARLIVGRGTEVLPRLTSGNYDIVFIDATKAEYPQYYQQGIDLLRIGGVIVFNGVLTGEKIADPKNRDTDTQALREVAKTVAEDERLMPAMLPVGRGLLAAARLV